MADTSDTRIRRGGENCNLVILQSNLIKRVYWLAIMIASECVIMNANVIYGVRNTVVRPMSYRAVSCYITPPYLMI
jgi:hypothetical protein